MSKAGVSHLLQNALDADEAGFEDIAIQDKRNDFNVLKTKNKIVNDCNHTEMPICTVKHEAKCNCVSPEQPLLTCSCLPLVDYSHTSKHVNCGYCGPGFVRETADQFFRRQRHKIFSFMWGALVGIAFTTLLMQQGILSSDVMSWDLRNSKISEIALNLQNVVGLNQYGNPFSATRQAIDGNKNNKIQSIHEASIQLVSKIILCK